MGFPNARNLWRTWKKNNWELHDVGNMSPVEQANAKCGTGNVCSSGARARAPACVSAFGFFGAFRRFGVFWGEARRGRSCATGKKRKKKKKKKN
jgi:hypothetical protein